MKHHFCGAQVRKILLIFVALLVITILARHLGIPSKSTWPASFSLVFNNFKSLDIPKSRNCWKQFFEDNEKNTLAIPPKNALCAFEPLLPRNYTRSGKEVTVVLGMGVHLGPAAADKFSLHKVELIEYISWEYRDKDLQGLQNLLIHGYSPEHLAKTQKAFWDRYHNDKDLKRADVIVCGFDTWHCLIFAPFNKKLILNSAYRFDGHIAINEANMVDLQRVLYNAVRYNPDVIMAGSIIYDVMYHQHFLGSHKMIPLPATCGYVKTRMRDEFGNDKCKGIPHNTSGYHPSGPPIYGISPKRLSAGGDKVASEIMDFFKKKEPKFNIVSLQSHLKDHYDYCDLGKYSALIVLGYSVMSFFSCECSSLGIPMFVPSPRLYAQWEQYLHLINERKGPLQHVAFDFMKQSSRSLNYGYNPNDDFDKKSLERWIGYADYFYYKGAVQFDSYEDLFLKIQKSDLKAMNEHMVAHDTENLWTTVSHWKNINEYFHGDEKNDVIPVTSSVIPGTLSEGLQIWEKKVKRPNFQQTSVSEADKQKSKAWVLIYFQEYYEDFKLFPNCKDFPDYEIVFYGTLIKKVKYSGGNGCSMYDLEDMDKPREWKNPEAYLQLAFLLNVIKHNPSRIVFFEKDSGCDIESKQLLDIVQNEVSSWKQRVFSPEQYFLAWSPVDYRVLEHWTTTVLKFAEGIEEPAMCSLSSRSYHVTRFTKTEELDLLDYLKYWKTDETENFFHVVDQLNFELSVRGFLTKSNAILHRHWMSRLAECSISTVPKLKTIKMREKKI